MSEKSNKNFYPLLIIGVVAGFISFLAWSFYQAAGLGSKVTDRDYYSKGLKYNATQLEKQAAEVLGWRLATRLNENSLEIDLTDSKGQMVEQAFGTLYLALPDTAENILLPLQEVRPGHYQINLDKRIKGSIQARVEFERQGARLNRQFLLNL